MYNNYDDIIVNFCERKIYPNQPEYINSISALYISIISCYNLMKLTNISTNISTNMLFIHLFIFTNGIAAFLYHWYALHIFKLFDEITMIIPVWLGLKEILLNLNFPLYQIRINTVYNTFILICNFFTWFEDYFPIFFLVDLLSIFYLYYYADYNYKYIKNYSNADGIKGISLSIGSIVIWIFTEKNCNEYMIFGHAIWHIGLSTGICYFITYFDKLPKILLN